MFLVTGAQMREMDQRTIRDIGIPGLVLMEHAALGAVQTLITHFDLSPPACIGILCGSGNNGGDGFAMARTLVQSGYQVIVVFIGKTSALQGDARLNFEILQNLNIPRILVSPDAPDELAKKLHAIQECEVWCDALLGTGLDRDVTGAYAVAIDFLNTVSRVFAIDIPSGLNADTGFPMGKCVGAHATASFGHIKLGQTLYPGRSYCGDIYLQDIGIPAVIREQVGYEALYLTEQWAKSQITPRPATFHKGDAGKVLLLAGSPTMSGAALLAAKGALHSGVGLLTVGTFPEFVSNVAMAVHEAMASAVLSEAPDEALLQRLDDLLKRVDCVAIGPGMGVNDGTYHILLRVLQSPVSRIVIDADALNTIASRDMQDVLSQHAAEKTVVLTPHPGEMARLCDVDVDSILQTPIEYARLLAQRTNALIVLKTASTIIASPAGKTAVNSSGNPGMATGGMGDALTGIIAAQLPQLDDPWTACAISVYAHGAAADECEHTTGHRGLTVTGLIDKLPTIWHRLEA